MYIVSDADDWAEDMTGRADVGVTRAASIAFLGCSFPSSEGAKLPHTIIEFIYAEMGANLGLRSRGRTKRMGGH